MKSSICWVGIASLAMLVASPALAQNAPPDTSLLAPPDTASAPAPAPSTPPATTTAPAPAPAAAAAPATTTDERTGSAPGRGGVGGLIGGSLFNLAEDYSAGAQPRFSFDGQYRYVMGRRWRFQIGPGFTWSAYSKTEPAPYVDPAFPTETTKEHYLTLMIPISAQLQLTWGKRPWLWHAGGGPGVYRVWVQHHRKVLRDPQTLRLHRGLYPGFTAQVGVERFLKTLKNTSVEFSVAQHYAMVQPKIEGGGDQFPSGWNSAVGALAVRLGGNYYFEPRLKKEPEQLPPSAR